MTALPLQIPTLNGLHSQLRQTLAAGLEGAVGAQETAHHHPPEPLPWPGVLHEVFPAPAGEPARFASHHPFPAGALITWAQRQLANGAGQMTVWIGRRIWPYPAVLDRAGLLSGSLFIDARDNNQRLWSAELALRCSAVASVIADGTDLGMSATRRLQLVSRASGALMLLARPSRDEKQLSAAGARWRVSAKCASGESSSPQWKVQLLRCKGVRPVSLGCHGHSQQIWSLRWDAEQASARFIGTDVEHEREDGTPAPAAAVPGGLPADVAGGSPPAPRRAPMRRVG